MQSLQKRGRVEEGDSDNTLFGHFGKPMSPARGPDSWVPNPGLKAGVGHLTLLEGLRRIRGLRQTGFFVPSVVLFIALLFLSFYFYLGNSYDDCKSIGTQASQAKSL